MNILLKTDTIIESFHTGVKESMALTFAHPLTLWNRGRLYILMVFIFGLLLVVNLHDKWGKSRETYTSPIRMHKKYTHVILQCANFTLGKQMSHANANTHRSIFTYG